MAKKSIQFLLIFFLLMSIVMVGFLVARNTLAVGSTEIYTRDELSEIINEQSSLIDNQDGIINDIGQIVKIYVNGSINTQIDETKNYVVDNCICNQNESAYFDNESKSLVVNNIKKNTTCNIYLKEGMMYQYKSYIPYYTFTAPYTGNYKIELWGAQGGTIAYGLGYTNGGKGAYTKGIISLTQNDTVFFYLGESGGYFSNPGFSDLPSGLPSAITYNGGGAGGDESDGTENIGEHGMSGGGATDMRLTSGDWSLSGSLNSRIMVAAGGSGSQAYGTPTNKRFYLGFPGGGLFSTSADPTAGATQFGGYIFGVGQNGIYHAGDGYSSGAGGGYYGGQTWDDPTSYPNPWNIDTGSGGSSYISEHAGCVAIASAALEGDIRTARVDSQNKLCSSSASTRYNAAGYNTDVTCSRHYSGKVFTNTLMIDGSGQKWEIVNYTLVKTAVQMPSPYGILYSSNTGHIGDGVAKITYNN